MRRLSNRTLVIGAVLAAVAVLAVLVVTIFVGRGPVYKGRPAMAWGRDLNSPDPAVRSNATDAVRALGAEAVPIWTTALRRQDPIFKTLYLATARAVPAAVRRPLTRVVKPFVAQVDRLAAANALSLLGPSAPVEPLLAALKGTDRQVSFIAATTLGKIGKPAVAGLIAALSDPDGNVRSLSCSALSVIGPPAAEAGPALICQLSDPHTNNRSHVIYALGRIGQPAVAPLLEALKSSDLQTRALAAFVLGTGGPMAKEVSPALIAATTDDAPLVRQNAVEALGKVRPASIESVRAFTAALQDGEPAVRLKALQALAKAWPRAEPAVPVLIKTLDDADAEIRGSAMVVLELIGPAARAAVPALKRSLADGNSTVRTKAAAALVKIDPDSVLGSEKTE